MFTIPKYFKILEIKLFKNTFLTLGLFSGRIILLNEETTNLCNQSADVNCQEDTTKRTPLHYALYIKKKDLFEYLLQHGADITKTDHRGTTIIHRCCTIQDASFLKAVLSFGRSLPRRLSTHTPLSTAQATTPLGTALQMGDGEGATPVIVACQNGNLEQLTLLVEAGAPVSNKDKFQRCALHHCVENPATECAEYLLRAIPSLLSCADEEGLTPLHMAVIAGNVPLVKLLLKRGANLKVVDNEKHTVVHWATVCGHADVLDLLIENGADVSAPDKHQAFPIHYAAQMMSKRGSATDSASSGGEGSLHILKTLLKHKVPPEAEDKDKRTPILWAASA
ncbi:ankyrin repeat domain-containing protein, partial [Elysia marginata]